TLSDGYWTILETVPYSIANAAPNQALTSAPALSNGSSGLLSGATVVVELPPDDLGNPVGNIQYTIPALTKNATTNTNTTSLLHKPQATTIQIVKQQPHPAPRQQLTIQHTQPHQQTHQQPNPPARQEYIKIDTSRLEDKMLLRDVMQYGTSSIAMAPHSNHNHSHSIGTATAAATATVVTNHHHHHEATGLLLADADEAERELELAAIKSDDGEGHHHPHDEEHMLDEEGYVVEKIHADGQPEKLYAIESHDLQHAGSNTGGTTMTLQQVSGGEYPLEENKYACNVCGKTYKIKGSLKRHKNYECGVEPNLKCPHCPHKCKYKSDLRKHMNQKHADSGDSILAH
ncbi:hypothetical protein KR018_003637, partial [Drosophila ironensis]